MPQLDFSLLQNVVVWTISFFFILYIIFIILILPLFAFLLKARKQLLLNLKIKSNKILFLQSTLKWKVDWFYNSFLLNLNCLNILYIERYINCFNFYNPFFFKSDKNIFDFVKSFFILLNLQFSKFFLIIK